MRGAPASALKRGLPSISGLLSGHDLQMMVSGRMAAQRGVDVTFGEHAHPSHALAQLTLVPGVGKPHESGPSLPKAVPGTTATRSSSSSIRLNLSQSMPQARTSTNA